MTDNLPAPLPDRAIVDPVTGELLALDTLDASAPVLDNLRHSLKPMVEDRIRFVERVVLDQLSELGRGTTRIGKLEVQRKSSNRHEWDLDELQKLLDLGLDPERYEELVKTEVTYKVNLKVANEIAAANPDYAQIIEQAHTVTPNDDRVETRVAR